MELLVTENRNACGKNRSNNTVRVFLQRDYSYGLWINENTLWELLPDEQRERYELGDGHLEVSFDVAAKILERGRTPFNKQKLYREV